MSSVSVRPMRPVRSAGIALAACGGVLAVEYMSSLPALDGRVDSARFTDTDSTALGAGDRACRGGPSGTHRASIRCRDARDAFAARVLLASLPSARSTCSTTSGTTTCPARCCSTRCGRRPIAVCACGCCWTTTTPRAWTTMLAALDAHPELEVRLFNPFVIRRAARARLSDRLLSPEPADAQQVVHRRQPGHDRRRAQRRRRVLRRDRRRVSSPISTCSRSARWSSDVSADFDRYWASESAYPADRILPASSRCGREALAAAAARSSSDPAAVAYMDALRVCRSSAT